MILLGSIERAQLQALLSQQLSRARRLEYIRERSLSEKKNLSVLTVPGQNDENQRASQEVRFQVRGHCSGGTRTSLCLEKLDLQPRKLFLYRISSQNNKLPLS